ncbi:MAG: hypothetical protein LLG97_11405 [Deltaproteobacteria bacterium]|nr:hypothetical protein [Deltaproteobacteria bacterium]
MKEAIEEAPVNTRAESKPWKYFRIIFGILFGLGFLFMIFKMAMNRFG